ncbi:MAG: ComEC/Rec2 family competence protein [Bacteroidota bacterium]
MKIIHASPLFRMLLPFVGGLLLASQVPQLSWCLVIALPLMGTGIILDKRMISFLWEHGMWMLVSLSFLFMGALVWQVDEMNQPTDLEAANCRELEMAVVLEEPVALKKFGAESVGHLVGIRHNGEWIEVDATIVLSWTQNSAVPPAQAFDSLYISGFLTNIYTSSEKYRAYLDRKGLNYRVYVKETEWGGAHQGLEAQAFRVQQLLSDRLGWLIGGDQLAAIGQAMFLGEKSHLSKATRKKVAAAGVSHILAISGLHVGIIFLLINWLLMPLNLWKYGSRARNLLILVVLLVYMFVTGASPAVIRAVVMLGTVVIFRLLYQRYHLLNLVALAAFIQLLWNPQTLYEIGFQLSYCAVCGILLLYPVFEQAVKSPYPALNKLYGWMGVSITATLATFPLCWYYFGQFPTYFLLSNVLLTTLSFILVLVGFLTVCCSSIPYLAELLGMSCHWLLYAFDKVVTWIASLPHAVITEFSWDQPEVWILFAELAIAGLLFILPKLLLPKKQEEWDMGVVPG